MNGAGTTELAVGNAAFVPFGSKVLFFEPGSGLPIHILGEGGEENSITLHLPKDYLVESILPSAKNDTWVVRAQSIKEFTQFQNNGVVVNPNQELFEVDPFSGDTLKTLHITGIHLGQVISAVDKKLIALRQNADVKDPSTPTGWLLIEQGR